MANLIVIPARHDSKRLPGKPLQLIAGRLLLERVAGVAMAAARSLSATDVVVATDSVAVASAAEAMGLVAVMTAAEISTGSARTLAALESTGRSYDLVVNLQGDAPFTEPRHLVETVHAAASTLADVTTPVVRLDWPRLDAMRDAKRKSPGSGTCCVRASDGRAIWFSKAVIPFIRDEAALRQRTSLSPVFQHIGLYCYRPEVLAAFGATSPTEQEQLEGLEQLRFFALGLDVRAIEVAPGPIVMSGIDSPEDIGRAEALIAAYGDPFRDWRTPS